jgi:ABC-type Zn2+ transport system substrate-binding protein/surface adhesin
VRCGARVVSRLLLGTAWARSTRTTRASMTNNKQNPCGTRTRHTHTHTHTHTHLPAVHLLVCVLRLCCQRVAQQQSKLTDRQEANLCAGVPAAVACVVTCVVRGVVTCVVTCVVAQGARRDTRARAQQHLVCMLALAVARDDTHTHTHTHVHAHTHTRACTHTRTHTHMHTHTHLHTHTWYVTARSRLLSSTSPAAMNPSRGSDDADTNLALLT